MRRTSSVQVRGPLGEGVDALVQVATPATAMALEPDLDLEENYRTTGINVTNTADLIALDEEVSGKPGDTVVAATG